MAMVFGFTGKTQLGEIAKLVADNVVSPVLLANPALLIGIVMLIAGFGFKIAAVPFQMWVPDVYEGAPTPSPPFYRWAVKPPVLPSYAGFFSAFGLPALAQSRTGE